MYIRTQNKLSLVNLENVSDIYISEINHTGYFNIRYTTAIDTPNLGTYYTEERAMEVLDMIVDRLRNAYIVFDMPKE